MLEEAEDMWWIRWMDPSWTKLYWCCTCTFQDHKYTPTIQFWMQQCWASQPVAAMTTSETFRTFSMDFSWRYCMHAVSISTAMDQQLDRARGTLEVTANSLSLLSIKDCESGSLQEVLELSLRIQGPAQSNFCNTFSCCWVRAVT